MFALVGGSIFKAMFRNAGSRIRPRAGALLAARAAGLLALAQLLPLVAAGQEQPAGKPGDPSGQPPPAAGAPAQPGAPGAGKAAPTRAAPPATPQPEGWRFLATGRADVGYDTNVFQTESATGDAFTQLGGWAAVSRNDGRTLLRGRVDVSGKLYGRFSRADEYEGLLDLTGARQFGPLRAGAILGGTYLDIRALDREGNLLPRSNLTSLASRAMAFGDLQVTRTLYLNGQALYRYKNYEETPDLTSLDYGEWSGELALSQYFPKRISIRVEGLLGQRDYSDLQAAQATGEILPANPLLQLRRFQGEARLRKRWGANGMLQATFSLRRYEDLYQDEMSSDQSTGTLRLRHPMGAWLFEVGGAFVSRAFDLRDSGAGEPLEEEYLAFDAHLERTLWAGARLSGGYDLFRRSTNDPDGDYTVGTWQLGLAHAF
ncbi:MAG TPA: hypothetical protein VIC59_06390 [Gemmatimonadota bacterium]